MFTLYSHTHSPQQYKLQLSRSHSWTWQCHMKVDDIPVSMKGFKLNFGHPTYLSLSTKSLSACSLSARDQVYCSLGNASGIHFLCLQVSHPVEIFLPIADKKRRPHMSCHQKQGARENTVMGQKGFLKTFWIPTEGDRLRGPETRLCNASEASLAEISQPPFHQVQTWEAEMLSRNLLFILFWTLFLSAATWGCSLTFHSPTCQVILLCFFK